MFEVELSYKEIYNGLPWLSKDEKELENFIQEAIHQLDDTNIYSFVREDINKHQVLADGKYLYGIKGGIFLKAVRKFINDLADEMYDCRGGIVVNRRY